MTAAATPAVFVSYRRERTAVHAGRLYDALAARYGEHNVFMDLELAPGVDFVERIATAVGSCRALLVVIGPEWAGGRGGASRLADPADFVRLEVETALRAADVTVIPVLVGGARMPAPDDLPPELRPLARRNAIELTDLRWRYDCERLTTALDALLGAAGGEREPARRRRPAPASVRALVPLWLEGVAVATAAGMLARYLADPIRVGAGPTTDAALILTTAARRAVVWAVIGAALAIWLGLRRGDPGRLPGRVARGLLLGALAGALGGAVFSGLIHLPDRIPTPQTLERIALLSLAVTGGVVGTAIGALWIPRRLVVGFLAGALGGVLAQLGANAFGKPPDVFQLGLNCLVISAVTLLAMLVLDVRAATVAQRAAPAPEAARA
jgi:TIR domain